MLQKIKNFWLKVSLKRKIGSFAMMVLLVMGLSAVFNIYIMDFSLGSFNVILNDNSRCHDFQEAMELEIKAFEAYMREHTDEKRKEYLLSCARSERRLCALPFDYERIGEERYARTWNIKNGYEEYSEARDLMAQADPSGKDFIKQLYEVYDMQSYLQAYARRLVQVTLKEGKDAYQGKVLVFRMMPYLILLFSAVMMAVVLCLTNLLSGYVISPLVKLANISRKIAINDFSENDVTVENKDEVGELVTAFNMMKHATEGYINTLKENSEMAELLHKEEMEKMDTEKRLDTARLELLKSQINPHFLFNTLNMIACTAKLEDAKTTEHMIASMSSLFRYNLKTSEQIVPLERELKVMEDYMYLQQMRFGSRIRYECRIEADAGRVMIPAFTLQPLAENSIIHGLSKKEQGGKIFLRVWKKDGFAVISVADTGTGIGEKALKELEMALNNHLTAKVGIGLGNIYQRIETIYQNGSFRIYSKEGHGTVIQMTIPQEEM